MEVDGGGSEERRSVKRSLDEDDDDEIHVVGLVEEEDGTVKRNGRCVKRRSTR